MSKELGSTYDYPSSVRTMGYAYSGEEVILSTGQGLLVHGGYAGQEHPAEPFVSGLGLEKTGGWGGRCTVNVDINNVDIHSITNQQDLVHIKISPTMLHNVSLGSCQEVDVNGGSPLLTVTLTGTHNVIHKYNDLKGIFCAYQNIEDNSYTGVMINTPNLIVNAFNKEIIEIGKGLNYRALDSLTVLTDVMHHISSEEYLLLGCIKINKVNIGSSSGPATYTILAGQDITLGAYGSPLPDHVSIKLMQPDSKLRIETNGKDCVVTLHRSVVGSGVDNSGIIELYGTNGKLTINDEMMIFNGEELGRSTFGTPEHKLKAFHTFGDVVVNTAHYAYDDGVSSLGGVAESAVA